MSVVDSQGRLFGAINVVDALVVMIAIAAVVAGVALIGGQSTATELVTVTGIATVDQPVADAVTESRTSIDDDMQSVSVSTAAAGDGQVELTITMNMQAKKAAPGAYSARGERLVVGRELSIDFGTAIVDTRVVDISATGGEKR